MKFFIDTADVEEIRALNKTGMLDGVTTNPSLGQDGMALISDICEIYANYPNFTTEVQLTVDGLTACRALRQAGIMVNVTLCFSAAQALLAAKAGATFVSPFIGRLDDVGQDGMALISDICEIYANYPNFTTEVLVASVRHPMHVVEAAKAGAHVATVPPKILRQLYDHPLTDKGLAAFLADWAKTGQSIL